MKRISYLALIAPCIAHGAPIDVTGIGELIVGGIVALYILWIIFSIAVAIKTTKFIVTRIVIASIIGTAPIIYFRMQHYASVEKRNIQKSELKERNLRITRKSIPYFQQRCQDDRVNRLLKPIAWSAGVLIDSDYTAKLQFADIPLPPLRPEAARIQFYKEYPNGYEKQFRSPIYWVYQFDASNVSPETKFSFIEQKESITQKVKARATSTWWLNNGQNNLSKEDKIILESAIKNLRNSPGTWITMPVTSSGARYTLSVKDISTINDRLHWVARGKITLTDKETDELIAEYIGFMRHEYPASEYEHSMHWEPAIPCDGEEKDFLSGRRWDVVRFFLERVIADNEKSGK